MWGGPKNDSGSSAEETDEGDKKPAAKEKNKNEKKDYQKSDGSGSNEEDDEDSETSGDNTDVEEYDPPEEEEEEELEELEDKNKAKAKPPKKGRPLKIATMADALPHESGKRLFFPRDLITRLQNRLEIEHCSFYHALHWSHRLMPDDRFPWEKLINPPEMTEEELDYIQPCMYSLKEELLAKIRNELNALVLGICTKVFPASKGYAFGSINDAIQVMRKDCNDGKFERTESVLYSEEYFGPKWELRAEEKFMYEYNIEYRQWKPMQNKKRTPKGFIAKLYSQVLNNSFRKQVSMKRRDEAEVDLEGKKIKRDNKYARKPVPRSTDRARYVRKSATYKIPVEERGINLKEMLEELQNRFNSGVNLSSYNEAKKVFTDIYRECTQEESEKEESTVKSTASEDKNPTKRNEEAELDKEEEKRETQSRSRKNKKRKSNKGDRPKDKKAKRKKRKHSHGQKSKHEKAKNKGAEAEDKANEEAIKQLFEKEEEIDNNAATVATPPKEKETMAKKKVQTSFSADANRKTDPKIPTEINLTETKDNNRTPMTLNSPASNTRGKTSKKCKHEVMLSTGDARYFEGPSGRLCGTKCSYCRKLIDKEWFRTAMIPQVFYCKFVGIDDDDVIPCDRVQCGDCQAEMDNKDEGSRRRSGRAKTSRKLEL